MLSLGFCGRFHSASSSLFSSRSRRSFDVRVRSSKLADMPGAGTLHEARRFKEQYFNKLTRTAPRSRKTQPHAQGKHSPHANGKLTPTLMENSPPQKKKNDARYLPYHSHCLHPSRYSLRLGPSNPRATRRTYDPRQQFSYGHARLVSCGCSRRVKRSLTLSQDARRRQPLPQ